MIDPYGLKRLPLWLWKLISNAVGREPSWDLNKLTYVVLDTETTGFDYGSDRILSIGALRLKEQSIQVGQSFEVFLTQAYYNQKTTEVHGILSREPRPCLSEPEALSQFLEYIGDDILVAHHAKFDITMINSALKRQGMPVLPNKVLDTSALFRKTLINSPVVPKKERYSLDELADKFDISKKDRHTALGDAYITALVFIRILHALKKKGITTWRQLIK